jgi:hypothetical protein
MLRFKTYLEEAFNIPIASEGDIDNYPSKADSTDLKKLFKYIKPIASPNSSPDVPMVGGAGNDEGKIKIRGIKGTDSEQQVRDWIKENLPDIKGIDFGNGKFGEGGTKINENTQEIMVAAICLLNETLPTTMSVTDANDLIERAKDKFKDVSGATERSELLDQFNGNYDDLGTAISSANAIREITGNISNTYWTGKGWHTDIVHLNPTVPGIKDYNSSDIVVKAGKKFYGFSLKKKKRAKDQDPTLINKPITGDKSFLSNILTKSAMDVIDNAKKVFFNFIVHKHYNIAMNVLSKLPWATRRKGAKSIGRYMNDIPKKKLDGYVRSSSNIFFKKVDSILMTKEYAEKFVEDFLKFVFKFDMPDKIKETGSSFEFFLLTGIGSKSGDNVIAEPAEVKDLPQTIQVLSDIFGRNKLSIEQTKGKTNAFQKNATAAKVYYTIKDEADPILYLEIRYKGSYTANPQFQCVATPNFKNMFKE